MNKNTRLNLRRAQKAFRKGATQFKWGNRVIVKPSPESGFVSCNPSRNMCERVLHNSGGGANRSLTAHEPIDKNRPVVFKGHREYKDFASNYKQFSVRA